MHVSLKLDSYTQLSPKYLKVILISILIGILFVKNNNLIKNKHQNLFIFNKTCASDLEALITIRKFLKRED